MKFYLPGWGWFVAALTLYLFYASNRSARNRRQNKSMRLKEKQEELLSALKEKYNRDGKNNKDEAENIE
jgi:hypothetical protein